MGVVVDDRAVLLDWEAGVGDLRLFGFTPSKKPTATTLAVVERCLDETNHVAETRWLDLDNMPTIGRRPVLVGRSVVWEVQTQHPDGPRHWLTVFAQAMDAAGHDGEIGPFSFRDPGRMDTLVDGRKVPSVMLALAWKGHGTYPNGSALAAWRTDHGVIPTLVDLAVRFLEATPGHTTAEVGQLVDLQAGELPEAIGRALAAESIAAPVVWARRAGLHLNRAITFDRRGHVLLSVATEPARLFEATEMICAEFGVVAGEHCEWAVLVEDGIAPDFADSYRYARGLRLPRYYERFRDQDADRLPDVFAWQMLGARHLANAHDLSRWTQEAVGDLTLVRTPDLTTWLTPDDTDPTRLKVDPDQLAQARQDFGPMILGQ